jgi:hypothetical protein
MKSPSAVKSAIWVTLRPHAQAQADSEPEILGPAGLPAVVADARPRVERRPVGWGHRTIPPAEAGWWGAVLAYGPDHPALVGTVAIAAAVGRRPQTIRLARMRGRMPPPVVVAGRLRWWRRDVQAWMLAHGHNPARLGERCRRDRFPGSVSQPQEVQ